jgi:hypothetical protein
MHRSMGAAILIALLTLTGGGAVADDRSAALGNALGEMRVACAHAPSTVCASRAAALFDRNGDGGVGRSELAEARRSMVAEAQAQSSGLNDTERGMVALAVAAFDSAGLDTVFAEFDANRDGRIDRAEMFADFRLDERPFHKVAGDPEAVDWPSLADRFGETGRMFLPLLLAAGKPAPQTAR